MLYHLYDLGKHLEMVDSIEDEQGYHFQVEVSSYALEGRKLSSLVSCSFTQPSDLIEHFEDCRLFKIQVDDTWHASKLFKALFNKQKDKYYFYHQAKSLDEGMVEIQIADQFS